MSDAKIGIVIPIDKPTGWTSFQVVNKLKWHLKRTFGLKKFKIGHAGTLDPLASGLLLVCVGSATKEIEYLQSMTKEYTGTMVIGATTPCYDLEQAIDAYYPTEHIDAEKIAAVCKGWVGSREQVPPFYSAVKVGGRRAYQAAREGEIMEIKSKLVTIYKFDIEAIRWGDSQKELIQERKNAKEEREGTTELYKNPQGEVPKGLPQIDFRVACSKGTYIRSLARDVGEELESGAFLSALRRVRIGEYEVERALTIDDIEQQIAPTAEEYACLGLLQTADR